MVKNIFRAYETKDKSGCEEMLTDDFSFTSPNNDDHINQDSYFERCWPFIEQYPIYEFEKIVVSGFEVFVTYNCETKIGKKFRNTELFKFNQDKIKEIEVYFGAAI
ncbi:MAG: nuclear transport factor 2 family protein [Ferruginibacter sp.]